MPKVPVYEQQVNPQQIQYSEGQVARPVEQAYGMDIADATSKVGDAAGGIAKALADHAVEVENMRREQQVLDVATQARSQLQGTLYSTDTDESGAPKGLMNRLGNQAQGATENFDGAYQSVKQDALNQVQFPAQKTALTRLLDNHYEQMRGTVIRHEAQQGREAYQNSVNTYLQQNVAQAGALTDPDALSNAISQANQIQAASAKRMGTDDATIQLQSQDLAASMTKAAFGPLLTQDYRKAKNLLDGVRDQLSPTAVAQFDQQLDGKRLDDTQQAVWNRVSGFDLSNGDPDEAKMQDFVMSMNLPADKKDKVWSYVKSRAAEQVQQGRLEDAAQDNAFTNKVLALKNQGGSMDDALKVVPQFGGDNSTQADRMTAVKKIFTTHTSTDAPTYIDLWSGIKDGTKDKTDVQAAYDKGLLSQTDYTKLIEDKYNALHKDDAFMQKETIDRVKDLADATYPNSQKQKRAEYLYTVLSETRGKSPEETWKTAQDLLKGDPNTGFHGLFQDDQWKTNLKTRDAQNTMWGQLHSDIGQPTVKAISQGILHGGKDKVGISDIQGFADALGGYNAIKKGAPANNAIQSLIGHKKLVTPESVKAVLSRYPDGNW